MDGPGAARHSMATGTLPDVYRLLSRVGCHVYSGLVAPDGTYRETYTGPGLDLMLGGTPEPDTDLDEVWDSAVHPDDWEQYQQFGLMAARSDGSTTMEYRLVGMDGETRWVLDRMWVRDRLGDGSLLVDGVVVDVSELHRRTAQANEASALLDAAVTMSPAALILMDEQGVVRLWNPAAERTFDLPASAAIGTVAPHIPVDDRPAYVELLRRAIEGDPLVEYEVVHHKPDGSRLVLSAATSAVSDPDGRLTGFLSVLTDVTSRKQGELRLHHLAHTDSLTGLSNRLAIAERLRIAAAEQPAGTGMALLLLDLDGFKAVNDSLGHVVGDELLNAVAGRLIGCLRSGDMAARIGGDEFAVLLETTDISEAISLGERVLETVAQPFSVSRAQVVVTGSLGIAFAGDLRQGEHLLRDADVAMYRAKAEGKNRLVVFEPTMQRQLAERLRLETDLRQAIADHRFELHYQPFVNLETGRIIGVEALVRWRHGGSLLSPADFIPVAEETGLIVPLGHWILREACQQAAAWQPTDPANLMTVAVNLSPPQLHDATLPAFIASLLEETGLPPNALTLEITEGLLLVDTPIVRTRLSELRSLGVQVAVDDFGTGYSSLAYLGQFPVDILKIDRSFIASLEDSPRGRAMVRSMLELARALEMDTVAEGVERQEQAKALAELGCRVAQGFLFSRPRPAAEVTESLRSHGVRSPESPAEAP